MAEIIRLYGRDYAAEKRNIEEAIGADPWFVLDNADACLTLDAYISNLFDNYDLGNRELSRLRICTNLAWPKGAVTLIRPAYADKNSASHDVTCQNPGDMAELLALLMPEAKAYLIIENDDRILLANILQQLIYLDYPIANLDVKLRKEFKDSVRVQMLMENLDQLMDAADSAVEGIEQIELPAAENRKELTEQKEKAAHTYREILVQLNKARKVEMRVAFAASKKTGKSVLVNCLLGKELAPTSLEMATPNTCIYKLSGDSNYHLHWLDDDGVIIGGKSRVFSTREETHKEINRCFKEAEKDKEGNFAIPDMMIEYPLEEAKRFSSYTIFDTPGPDAAGTAHRESANRAMEQCDASVFAIDYSKYLTETEENYLETVKDLFESKGKFHSLLFTINKMDLALGDSGAKSRVKSIDFIRNRLRDINPRYGDCIIFATSAQDYFNTLVLEKAAKHEAALEPLAGEDADWGADFRGIKKQLKGSADNVLMTALSNLESETVKIEDLLEYDKVNLKTMRLFSGMPQMMSYLEYVLTSKAREEIINSIAYTIGLQAANLKTLIEQRENLLVLMEKNDNEIKRISEILSRYRQEIYHILGAKLTREVDLALVAQDSLLVSMFDKEDVDGLSLDAVVSQVEKMLNEKRKTAEEGKKLIWNSYSSALLARLNSLKRRGGIIRKDSLGLNEDETSTLVNNAASDFIKQSVSSIGNHMAALGGDLRAVLSHRFLMVDEASERCRRALEKENVNLVLPELPKFNTALPEPGVEELAIETIGLANSLQQEFQSVGIVENLWSNFLEYGLNFTDYDLDARINMDKVQWEEIEKNIGKTQAPFLKRLDECDFGKKLEEIQKKIVDEANASQKEIARTFEIQIGLCNSIVDTFCKSIDEREKFQEDSRRAQTLMDLLDSIKRQSASFIELWVKINNAEVSDIAKCGEMA